MIPTTASVASTGAKNSAAAGNSGKANRTNPYVPIFSSTPARITDPAVGASTCASGSQVWNGNSGTFTANASANARKNQNCRCAGIASAYIDCRSKLYELVVEYWSTARPTIASSISTLPAIV